MKDRLVLKSPVEDLKKTPAMNGPCICGSGDKYKKCCYPNHSRYKGGVLQKARAPQAPEVQEPSESPKKEAEEFISNIRPTLPAEAISDGASRMLEKAEEDATEKYFTEE